ncbi:MAG: transcriptional modulator of MazE/toxin, MazF [Clostridiales bacterium]|jgi:mRNA interferase MazF|nr:transcriptional modulator of MazE/toxin, MazF [Clostridiales bacterium]
MKILGNTKAKLSKKWRVNNLIVKRGDIFYADLRPVVGSEQGGIRPVLIIQNDIGNKYSPTIICAAITSQINKAKLPTHVEIDSNCNELVKDSVILVEQVRTIDKKRLREKVCHLAQSAMKKVDKAILISMGIDT